jgi:type IV secretion system protein TrbJ
MKKTILTITAIALTTVLPLTSPGTGIPVIDVSAIAQAIKQGLTQIQQLTQEINSYQTLLLQYKNQLIQATGIGQAAQIWSQAQGSMNQVMGTVNMFRGGGGVQGYLQNFRDVNYWMSAPSNQYGSQTGNFWSASQKTANSQLVAEISQQEQQIQSDSALLQRLQSQAGSIGTQRQALDVSNELAGLQGKQLLEIRALLISEQQALAARNGSQATQQSMQQSATQQLMYSPSSFTDHQGWKP